MIISLLIIHTEKAMNSLRKSSLFDLKTFIQHDANVYLLKFLPQLSLMVSRK